MTARRDERPPVHAWTGGLVLWDVYYAVGYLGCAGLLLISDAGAVRRAIGVTLLVVLGAGYALAGRRIVRDDIGGWRAYGYVAASLVLFAALAVATPAGTFALFLLCPQCFMVLRFPHAVVAVLLLNLVPLSAFVRGTRSPAQIATIVVGAVVIITLSVLFGLWTERIIDQSRERHALIERLRDSQEEIARLSRETGTMAERERLAAEIHDTLAQGFTSVLMLVQAAESELGRDDGAARHHLGLAGRTARENLDEARALVAALRPTALASTSLDQALARLVERTGEETGIAAEYATDAADPADPAEYAADPADPAPGADAAPLAPAAEVVLLRATQEALANVRKHARASRVSVRLERRDGRVLLTVTDDGVGFDPARTAEAGCAGGYGLAGMRARVRDVGGALTVRSAPGEGTYVAITVGGPGGTAAPA